MFSHKNQGVGGAGADQEEVVVTISYEEVVVTISYLFDTCTYSKSAFWFLSELYC
jgi:hypothetical protein